MTGETNLTTLLRSMKPTLASGNYVFCPTTEAVPPPLAAEALGLFREAEGLTVILTQEAADRYGLSYDFLAVWITLTVHSSLAAVGLTAAVAQALAAEGISCNVVAAYYHDHLFVAQADAGRAMRALHQLAEQQLPL